jgi:hypothetical protein
MKGSGKTTLAKEIIKSVDRAIIFDVLNEYEFGKIIKDWQEFADELSNLFSENGILKKDEWKFTLKIDNGNFLYRAGQICWVFGKYFAFYKLDWWICFEEASLYVPNNSNNIFLNFPRYGRHYLINQIFISRNTAELSKQVISQSDLIVSFKQIEPRHKKVLSEYGFNINKLEKLEKFDYICVGDCSFLNSIIKKTKKVLK